MTQTGVELVTDHAVTIPAEDTATIPPTNGETTVAAHAAWAGGGGNIGPLALNAIIGSSLYVKNLTAFTGGQDARTEHYATEDDISRAVDTARARLATTKPTGLQVHPCQETVTQEHTAVTVTWACQYGTYAKPAGRVLTVLLQGNRVVLSVQTIVYPQ